MLKTFFLFSLFYSFNFCTAQNLVNNPSFEDTVSCPNDYSQIDKCMGWRASVQSPDYFNSCSSYLVGIPSNVLGYQYALTGKAYCGILIYATPMSNIRETISGKLLQPLIKGNKYYTSLNVSLADNCFYNCNNLGISFSTIPLTNGNADYFVNKNRPFVYTKTIVKDYTNWVHITGSFIADSNYQYVFISNFYTDNVTQRGISESPTSIGNEAYYYIDDVCVSMDSLTCVSKGAISGLEEVKKEVFRIYPNPFTNNITIKVTENSDKEVVIFDVLSKEMIRQTFSENITLDLRDLSKGIYYYEIRNELGVMERGKMVKE